MSNEKSHDSQNADDVWPVFVQVCQRDTFAMVVTCGYPEKDDHEVNLFFGDFFYCSEINWSGQYRTGNRRWFVGLP